MVDELSANGVTFEQYEGDLKTNEKGIFEADGVKVAWFRDPDGNTHALNQVLGGVKNCARCGFAAGALRPFLVFAFRRTLGSRALRRRKGAAVKLVIGIVRPEKANDVLEALYRAEVRGVSISRVQGHGGELDRVETYRGTTVQVGLADKVRFEIAVSDPFVEPTVQALADGARTGEVGDGKIFVVPVERVVRIRTGETDDAAVTPVGA